MSLHPKAPMLSNVFVTHRGQLTRIAQKIVRSVGVAEDVIQDAYVKIVDNANPNGVLNPVSYCCQVVRNLAYDHCRDKLVEDQYRVYVDVDVEESFHQSGGPRPDRLLAARRALEVIDKLLDAFPARARLAFELYRLGGLRQREIAGQLGCSAATVNSLIKEINEAITPYAHLVDADV